MCLTLSFLLLFLLFSFLSHISISHYTDSSFLFAFCFHLLILFSAYHLIVLFPLLFRHISFILYSWTPLFPFLALSFSSLFFFFFLIPLSHTHTSFLSPFLLTVYHLIVYFFFISSLLHFLNTLWTQLLFFLPLSSLLSLFILLKHTHTRLFFFSSFLLSILLLYFLSISSVLHFFNTLWTQLFPFLSLPCLFSLFLFPSHTHSFSFRSPTPRRSVSPSSSVYPSAGAVNSITPRRSLLYHGVQETRRDQRQPTLPIAHPRPGTVPRPIKGSRLSYHHRYCPSSFLP